MASFTWTLQGTTPTALSGTYILFSRGTRTQAIIIDTYNSATHANNGDSDSNSPKNSKFISQTGGTDGDSQVDIGAGTVDLDTVTTANCPLKINFSHDEFCTINSAVFFGYGDDLDITEALVGMTAVAAEQGDANWTALSNNAATVSLDDKTDSAKSHDYYLLLSVKPTSNGQKQGYYRIELTYV